MIDLLRWLVDLQIPGQMPEDKPKQDESRDCHDGLFADGGIPETQLSQREISGGAHSQHLVLQVGSGFKKIISDAGKKNEARPSCRVRHALSAAGFLAGSGFEEP